MKNLFTNFLFVLALAVFSATASYSAFPAAKEPVTNTVVSQTSAQNSEQATTQSTQTTEQYAAKMHHHNGGSGKSQLVALLLCLLVGGLGIHRFYLGYTTAGIIQLLTAGGCGIWALIDLIRIITGDLKPKNGSYDQTL